jgi:hypothetical protein
MYSDDNHAEAEEASLDAPARPNRPLGVAPRSQPAGQRARSHNREASAPRSWPNPTHAPKEVRVIARVLFTVVVSGA